MHMNGASALFLVLCFHMERNESELDDKGSVEIIGAVIFLFIMLAAFLGYLLP